MNNLIAVICLIVAGQVNADSLTSPNEQYKIEYLEALPYESNVNITNAKTGKVLLQTDSSTYDPQRFGEMVWSADSKYLAVIKRGTRTTTSVVIFYFSDDKVEELEIPGYSMTREKEWTGRSYFVKDIKWEGTKLKYYCYGDKVAGGGDSQLVPDNWYHYDVTIQFEDRNKPTEHKLLSIAATSPDKKKANKAEMATPRKPSD